MNKAAILTSVGSGNWTTASTWSPTVSPADGDVLVIQPGHQVTISGNLSYTGAPMQVEVHGTWRFDGGGAKISMPANSLVTVHEGGTVISTGPGASGNSQTITIGPTVFWNGGQDGDVSGPTGWPYNVLPVELLSFKVAADADRVRTAWTTASERAASHFDVQRSADAMSWSLVGQVEAAGNSAVTRHYGFDDHHVPAGTWYYRLVLGDEDGTRTPKPIASVRVHGMGGGLRCHPDPLLPGHVRIMGDVPFHSSGAPMWVDVHTGRSLPATTVEQGDTGMLVRVPEGHRGIHLIRLEGHGSCRFMLGN